MESTDALTAKLYDIGYDVNWTARREDRKPWERLTRADAESDLLAHDETPDDVVQEYEITDRIGRPPDRPRGRVADRGRQDGHGRGLRNRSLKTRSCTACRRRPHDRGGDGRGKQDRPKTNGPGISPQGRFLAGRLICREEPTLNSIMTSPAPFGAQGDSDPDADELLRRARQQGKGGGSR